MDKRKQEQQKSSVVSASKRMTEYEGNTGGSGVSPPKGVALWQPKKEGEYRISILPFRYTDKIKKFVAKKTRFGNPGDLHYEQTYHNHRGVGPNNQTFICPAGTFNKPCPVCEFRSKAFQDPDRDKDMEKLLKDLKPKERQLWLVFDHDDEKKDLQLWDVSFYLFGENLFEKINRIKDPKKKARADAFADPRQGSVLVVGASEKTMGAGKPFLEFTDIQFEARESPLPKELVRQALETDLAACVKEPDYKELKKVFTTGLAGSKDEDEPEKEDEDEDEDTEGAGGEEEEEGDDEEADGGVEEDDDDEEGEDEGAVADEDSEGGGEEEDEGEEVTPKYRKGQRVVFKTSKGKKLTGTIVGVKTDPPSGDPFYRIENTDVQERPFAIPFDDVLKAAGKPEPAEDEEEEKPKRKGKKKLAPAENDEFEELFGGEDEEEEEKPKKKSVKKGKKKLAEDEDDDDSFGDAF